MAINPRTLAIEAELQAFLDTILDRQTRDIVQAWALAWDQTEDALEAAMMELAQATQTGRVTRTQVIRSQRAQAAMGQLGAALEQATARTGTIITADLAAVIEQAVGAEVGMIESQLTGTRRAELRANLVRADPGQISAMVERATQQITATILPLAAETYATVRAELLRGIAVGENPRQAARRMVRAAEDRTNFGLSRAMTIARTEALDATRAAQYWSDQANTAVLAGWVWTAHLDPRTCRSCVARHGTLHDLDTPGPLDHQNGRCARVPKTKSWEELGFAGIEDPPDATPDAEAWFAGLTEAQQRGMLTDRGYEAWKAGDYPMGDWSARRTAEGWRDSYGVSRPPTARASLDQHLGRIDAAGTPAEVGQALQNAIGDRGRVFGFADDEWGSWVDVELTKEAASEFVRLMDEFPEIRTNFGVGSLANSDAYASVRSEYDQQFRRVNHDLMLHPNNMLGSKTGLDGTFARGAETGHFRVISDEASPMEYLVSHEFGHLVDFHTQHTAAGAIDGTFDGYFLNREFVAEAFEQGVDPNTAEGLRYLRENTSTYGRTNREESIAESFADVWVNGDDASPLSRAVYDSLLRRIRGG